MGSYMSGQSTEYDPPCDKCGGDPASCDCYDLPGLLPGVLALSKRRLWLCKNTPACPSCGEWMQIQITDWHQIPAEWKCRKCKHKWKFEPAEESK